MNNELSPTNVVCDITGSIPNKSVEMPLTDTTEEKTQIEKRREYCQRYHQRHEIELKERRRSKFLKSQQQKFEKIKLTNPNPPSRQCPSCGITLYYNSVGNRNRSEKSKSLCNSCKFSGTKNPAYKKPAYNKGIFTITEEQRRKDARNRALKRNFGITQDNYDSILISQENKCKICGIPQTLLSKPLYVDHCHNTKQIRGLLCRNCNTGLGLFKDNSDILQMAARYLNQSVK
jgi:tRNA G26 N,N-dimethylase Trm1